MPRIIIDLTTLARWHGTITGIPRCQSKYAGYALRHLPNAVFTIFDPRSMRFRVLSRQWAHAILEDRARIDMSMMPDPTGMGSRSIEKVPSWLHGPYWWITQTRRKVLAKLEDWRLSAQVPALRNLSGKVQVRLLPKRRRELYIKDDGSRIDRPSLDVAAPSVLELGPGDTTIAMQADWADINMSAFAAMKQAAGFRHVVLCHDIIPIQFPEWYSAFDAGRFKFYYDRAFAIADRVMFTSRRTAEDATAYCRTAGLDIAEYRVSPMGSDPLPPATGLPLPDGLAAGKYILFVSTIEPRKNHQLLVDAWRCLVADETVAKSGYRLVFVGRKGWMVDDLLDALQSDPALSSTVLHLEGVDDAALSTLYRDAAFCVYPPKFEGFGLPPIEALAAGKALIVSDAGPMPEVVGEFGLCLDPNDLDLWTTRLRDWIVGCPERAHYAALAQRYRAVTWDEAAEKFFTVALEPG